MVHVSSALTFSVVCKPPLRSLAARCEGLRLVSLYLRIGQNWTCARLRGISVSCVPLPPKKTKRNSNLRHHGHPSFYARSEYIDAKTVSYPFSHACESPENSDILYFRIAFMRDTSPSMSNAPQEACCLSGNIGGFLDSYILLNNWQYGSDVSSRIRFSGGGSSFASAISNGKHPSLTTPRINMLITSAGLSPVSSQYL